MPIGKDDFRKIRDRNEYYYVDKSLLIKDFIEYKNKAALITRPQCFGKTLNMSMIREFFDITKDSKTLFEELAIMDTEHAGLINSRPVIYFTFKDCKGRNSEELKSRLTNELFKEYRRYSNIFGEAVDKKDLYYVDFYQILQIMVDKTTTWISLNSAISHLLTAVATFFWKKPYIADRRI